MIIPKQSRSHYKNVLDSVEDIAKVHYNGYYMLISTPNYYQGVFGKIPNDKYIETIQALQAYESRKDLLEQMIINPKKFHVDTLSEIEELPKKQCVYCSKLFTPNRPKNKYCHHRCSVAVSKLKRKIIDSNLQT